MSIQNNAEVENSRAIHRPDGVTDSERYLHRLCERCFLSLWSYPGVYRDQGGAKSGDGKEVCDLLVVFQDHVLIFSDKNCMFPDSGDLGQDWCRWFRRAVLKSAEQVWGAERWIRTYPDRLFLDRACTQRFPIEMPDPTKVKFHRIVVAHAASRRCRERLEGSGSLMLAPSIVGSMHYTDKSTVRPFHVGQVDPSRGFVHVLDDTSLDILLRELDTAVDFIAYLAKKEAFIQSGRLVFATGEEDLLAYYLSRLNAQDEHDFVAPANIAGVLIDEGLWEEFAAHPCRLAQTKANEVSYAWDALIEKFNHHIMGGTWYDQSGANVSDREKAVRLMASECRTARRILAKSLLYVVANSCDDKRSTRVMLPVRIGGPFYIFLLLPHLPDIPEREYREVRGKLLGALCMVVKLKYQEAKDIVGLATEAGPTNLRSEDVVYLDARHWSEELQTEAKSLQHKLGLLTNLSGPFQLREYEYPEVPVHQVASAPLTLTIDSVPSQSRVARNSLCPCGSGKKYKRCCRPK